MLESVRNHGTTLKVLWKSRAAAISLFTEGGNRKEDGEGSEDVGVMTGSKPVHQLEAQGEEVRQDNH